MSVHMIYYKNGAKMMRPILTREEYMTLRDSTEQQQTVKAVRSGDEARKQRLKQKIVEAKARGEPVWLTIK